MTAYLRSINVLVILSEYIQRVYNELVHFTTQDVLKTTNEIPSLVTHRF